MNQVVRLISVLNVCLLLVSCNGSSTKRGAKSTTSPSNFESTVNDSQKLRDFLLATTFINEGSGSVAYIKFKSENGGGWFGAMILTIGSCDFVYSYNLEERTISLTYTGSTCDAAFEGGSNTLTITDDSFLEIAMQGKKLIFKPVGYGSTESIANPSETEGTAQFYEVGNVSVPVDKVPPEGLYVCSFGNFKNAIKVEIQDNRVKLYIGEDKSSLNEDAEATIDENGQIGFSEYPTAWYEGDGVIVMMGYYFRGNSSEENVKFIKE